MAAQLILNGAADFVYYKRPVPIIDSSGNKWMVCRHLGEFELWVVRVDDDYQLPLIASDDGVWSASSVISTISDNYQEFIPTLTADITSVDLIINVPGATPDGNLRVGLKTTVDGSWLTYVDVAGSSLNDGAWNNFNFTDYGVTRGTTYYVCAIRDSSSGGGISWEAENLDVYEGGRSYTSATWDMALRINQPGLWSSQRFSDIHGAGGNLQGLHAAIDSNDIIHIISAGSYGDTREICYNTFTLSTMSWGTWEELAGYTDGQGDYSCSISIDSNDKPHVVFTDGIKHHGSEYDQPFYAEKTGASWSTPYNISDSSGTIHSLVFLTLRNSDYVETYFRRGSDGYKNSYTGSWGGATLVQSASIPRCVVANSSGTVDRYSSAGSGNIYRDSSDTGYDTDNYLSATLDATPDRYVFYIERSAFNGVITTIMLVEQSCFIYGTKVQIMTAIITMLIHLSRVIRSLI
jgi:hypothetical protein